MSGYWLNCNNCKKDFRFNEITKSPAIASYLWYKFFESDCDQSLLKWKCPECDTGIIQMAYNLKDGSETVIKVNHIVFRSDDKEFYQMLWETYDTSDPNDLIFDFKYMNGNNPLGLNKPVIMRENQLSELIQLFNKKCHKFL